MKGWIYPSASLMKEAHASFDSYATSLLAEEASCDRVAAPVTIDSLVETLEGYLDKKQISRVRAAYDYAARAHEGQFRLTGHPYITHPLAVANILAGMRMDHRSLMAALLHDVIEDTEVGKKTLRRKFGAEVAEIVDGVSKLKTIFNSRAEAQAENFQKMAIAMAKDLRVILVKLADRLHNMRTIGVHPTDKRRRIARETLEFYAPIANRLGIHTVKVEIEDLGFKALYPLRADRIERAVVKARGNRKALMEEIDQSIATALRREGILAEEDRVLASDWVRIDPGYVIFDQKRQEVMREVVPALESLGVYLTGRYGAWTYSYMEHK